MRREILIGSIFLLVAAISPASAVVVVIDMNHPLDTNPDPYIIDIEQMEILNHSAVELYIQNIEDPLRYKDWELTIYIPQGYQPLTQLDIIDYNAPNLPLYVEKYDVPLEGITSIIPGYDAYHASTYEAQWNEYGTEVVGTGGDRVPIGNPAWISYHFYVDDNIPDTTPIFISIYDECVIPEPGSIFLLGFGSLLLSRRRRA